MIAIDLRKQQELDADPKKKIQQINSSANLDQAGETTISFHYEESKEYCESIMNVFHKVTTVNLFSFQ